MGKKFIWGEYLMRMMNTAIFACLMIYSSTVISQTDKRLDVIKHLRLPEGFKISIFSDQVPNARSLSLGENGVVFVGTGAEGKVYALQDTNQDGLADKIFTLAENLNMPNGVAYRNGSLYVAEIHRIIRFDNIIQNLQAPPNPMVVYDKFPTDKHHGWKYLRFGPDGKLYTAVGAPCNICLPKQPVYASLVRLNTDGSHFEILANGIRNTVGFDWQPDTQSLFFNDNGRDYLGDDSPPEELNQWTAIGENFGFPYCHGGFIADPEFGDKANCKQFKAPVWQYKAHVAPLGLRFYQGSRFPRKYQKQLFVAQHGSWNRSQPDGYRVAVVSFKDHKPMSEQIFIDGWLSKNNVVLGRPVDILEMPEGNLLISDDALGVVYSVEYTGKHD